MDMGKLRYRPHLDGLRAIAVLAVLGYHAFPDIVPGGFVGVDVFFVLSGFLISSILYSQMGEPGSRFTQVMQRFYWRRIRRIFPALLVVLAACLVLGLVLLIPGEFTRLARSVIASAGFYLNFLLSGQTGYFDASADSNPVLHLWSLAVEEQFYLVWPLIVWCAFRTRLKILPVAVFLAACSWFWNAQKDIYSGAADFYLPQIRLWELLIGAIAAAVFYRRSDRPPGMRHGGFRVGSALAEVVPAVGIALILKSFLLGQGEIVPPNNWTLLPTFGALGVVCSSDSAWINRRILSNPMLVGLGLISYPLYLWHWPLLAFARIAAVGPLSRPWAACVLALAGLLAWLTYRFVERPIRFRPATTGTAFGLATAMAVIAGLGFWVQITGGLPSRFPRLINAISNYDYNPAVAVRQGEYFLNKNQDETAFKRDPNEILKTKPTLFLWGDSHAAALYPGIRLAYGKTYNIVQRTQSSTPPFMPEYYNPGNTQQVCRYVFELIVRERPAIVFLEADWQAYDWKRVETTLIALKAARVPHIVLVGPVPHWAGSLPQQLFNYVRTHRSEPVPVRMTLGLDPIPLELDPAMAALAARLGVEYISPCRILGNQDGFLVRTGDTADSLVTYDSNHLTASGSKYLVARFPKF